jgi:hypothetical protein
VAFKLESWLFSREQSSVVLKLGNQIQMDASALSSNNENEYTAAARSTQSSSLPRHRLRKLVRMSNTFATTRVSSPTIMRPILCLLPRCGHKHKRRAAIPIPVLYLEAFHLELKCYNRLVHDFNPFQIEGHNWHRTSPIWIKSIGKSNSKLL